MRLPTFIFFVFAYIFLANGNLVRINRGATKIEPASTTTTKTHSIKIATDLPKYKKEKKFLDQVKQKMNFKGENIDLNLTLNENVNSDMPILLASRTNIRQHYPAEPYSAYYDKDNSVSVVIKMKKNANGTEAGPEIMHGIFSRNNAVFKFQPSKQNSKKKSYMNIDGRSMDHEEEDGQFMAAQCLALESKINSTIASMSRRKRQSNLGTFTVETLIVVDYSIYNRFYQLSTQTTPTLKNMDAQANIQYYFVNVANGVSQRYNSITGLNFAISIRLVGIYIALDSTSSYFTDSAYLKIVNNGETLVDGTKAYTQFKLWTSTYAKNNGKFFDQATLFTNYRMYFNGNSGSGIYIVTGLGHIGSICQIFNTTGYESYSTTINSERGMFASMGTMAHEMGHNLNSSHDGESNTCSYADQYIMAPSPGPLNANNFNNIFKFSTCSPWYMGNFLRNLNYYSPGNCLKVSSGTLFSPPIDQRLPGIKYSLDYQCRVIFGTASYYCAGDQQTPCSLMECFNPAIQACEVRVDIRAFEGSLCGNKKWCIGGYCVFDISSPASPTAGETCAYGNYKGAFGVATNPTFTCSQLYVGSPNTFLCYDTAYTYLRCCASCDTIKSQNPPNCPYGDMDPIYCATGTKDRCYESAFNTTCCGSCAKWRIDKPGCEYGDRYPSTCTMTANYCYSTEASCCDTCGKYLDPNADYNCRYGDKVTWCNTLDPFPGSCPQVADNCCKTCKSYVGLTTTTVAPGCRDIDATYCSGKDGASCYYLPTRTYCCSTCAKFYTGISGCEYGNSAPWCASYITSQQQCSDPTTLLSCCKTCRDYNTVPATTSTTTTISPPVSTCLDTDASYCNNLKASDCYYTSTRDYCCSTCRRFYTGVIGCEYGDKASWCPSYVTSYQSCADSNTIVNCCFSCSKYGTVTTTTTTIAPCSDLAYWCPTLYAGQCYDAQTESTCCATCTKLRRPSPTCRYGDKYSWCAPIYCSTDKQNCCVSCP